MGKMEDRSNRAAGKDGGGGDAPSRDIKNIDKTIMDNFYKLVHTQPSVRLTAACSTFKILTAMKRNKASTFNEHLNYCVERLVTGLASSRALARKGYATLLLEVLRKHQVSTERLFTLAQQKFGNISNETSKDNLLGYYLLINVVLESGNYKRTKQNSAHLDKMYKILVQLTDHKSYFDTPVAKLLTDRCEIFYEHMLAEIPPAAFGSDVRLTHTELLSLSLCNQHKPIAQLSSLSSADVLRMSEVLNGDKLKRRPLHPVWIEWSKTLMQACPNHLPAYMTNVVHPNFFKPNHNDLAALGLELTAKLVANMDCLNHVPFLLPDYIIRLLIVSMRTKNPLSKHCTQFVSSIADCLKNMSQDEHYLKNMIPAHIFKTFIKPPGSLTFDEDSKSHTLVNLINACGPSSLKAIASYLMSLLDNKTSPAEGKRALPVVGRLLAHLTRRPQMPEMPDLAPWLAKCLIVNSLFSYVDPLAKDKQFWSEQKFMPAAQPLDMETKLSLKKAYHAAMDHIVSSSSALQRITTLGSLVDMCHQLIHGGAVCFLDTTGDITKMWQYYMVSLIEYRKLCEINKDPKILYPISSLYLLYGLQVVEHGLNCREQVDDLYQAAQDALKNDPSDGSWADILTDQIISILSATECNSWIRKLCVSVFGSLLPHISETSIDLLCDVIKAPLDANCDDEDEDGEDEEEEDDCSDREERDMSIDQEEEEEEGEETAGTSPADGNEGDDDKEEGGEEEDEEMEFTDGSDTDGQDSQSDMDISAQVVEPADGKSKGKKAGAKDKGDKRKVNGKSKENSLDPDASEKGDVDSDMEDEDEDDEEEEEEEYLDDEQMMKLDSVLVDMFKMNRVGKKKKRDPSFKLRCLDLIKKVVAKKHNDAEVIKKILSTIIPLAAKSRKSADTRPIADKINTMIDKMPGKSKLNIAGLNGKRGSRGAPSAEGTAVDQQQLVVGTA